MNGWLGLGGLGIVFRFFFEGLFLLEEGIFDDLVVVFFCLFIDGIVGIFDVIFEFIWFDLEELFWGNFVLVLELERWRVGDFFKGMRFGLVFVFLWVGVLDLIGGLLGRFGFGVGGFFGEVVLGKFVEFCDVLDICLL